MNMRLNIIINFLMHPNTSVWEKKTKNYISKPMALICDKSEKITIVTFVNVKKKQRPKALLFSLNEM